MRWTKLTCVFLVFTLGPLSAWVLVNKVRARRTDLVLMANLADQNRMAFVLHWDPGQIDRQGEFGETALHASMRYQESNMAPIKLLFDCGARVDVRNNLGYTSLHSAAINDVPKALPLLIEAGADIEANSNDGWTPLHCACLHGVP